MGIDLAFAKGKRLPLVVCTWRDRRLIPEPLRDLDLEPPRGRGNPAVLSGEGVREFVEETATYLAEVCRRLGLTPGRIGIDAPSAPRSPDLLKRQSERALAAERISCFTTPSLAEFNLIRAKAGHHLDAGASTSTLPYANKLWMLVGFELFGRLSRVAPCIEVFPQATARVLGCTIHKSKPGGVEAQLAAAARYTGWPLDEADRSSFARMAWSPAHDRLDAYLSAWVASLPEADRRGYGDQSQDTIWVPRLPCSSPLSLGGSAVLASAPVAPKPRAPSLGPSATPPATLSRWCPACNGKLFKRWPWGWDGHAAVCAALESADVVGRREEFKRKYGDVFPSSVVVGTPDPGRENVWIEEVAALPPGFDALLAESRSEGWRFLDRLYQESQLVPSPLNAAEGSLFAASDGEELLGICALCRDPFLDDSEIGRLRHLYVTAAARRRGIGRRLVEEVIRRARRHFRRIRLRTESAAAASFYVALGFTRTAEEGATHELILT